MIWKAVTTGALVVGVVVAMPGTSALAQAQVLDAIIAAPWYARKHRSPNSRCATRSQ